MRLPRLAASFRMLLAATAASALAASLAIGCGQDGVQAAAGAGGGGSTDATSTTGSSGGGGSVPGKPLVVMNWNVHNFFNDKKDSPLADEWVETTANYQKHLAAVGAVVKAMKPDVLVMQEVENMSVLKDLNDGQLGSAYSDLELIDANDQRGIDLGVMSKVKFDSVVSHKDDVFTLAGTNGPNYHYSRDCLELHLTFNGRKLVLLGVHFRSKVAPDDPDKRLAEAQHTRAIADALTAKDPSLAVAILGDFNDTPASTTYLAVQGKDYADAPNHIADADRWSMNYNGVHELVDHQFDDPELAKLLDVNSVTIRHGVDVDTASDHSPVMATYEMR